jgi:hypothetical protein
MSKTTDLQAPRKTAAYGSSDLDAAAQGGVVSEFGR